jgi:hypothetical protein
MISPQHITEYAVTHQKETEQNKKAILLKDSS